MKIKEIKHTELSPGPSATILFLLFFVVWSLSRVQLCNPKDCKQARLLCPWDSPCKNTGVGCHFLLQGILLTQELNAYLLNWQAYSLPRSYLGSTTILRITAGLGFFVGFFFPKTKWTPYGKHQLCIN